MPELTCVLCAFHDDNREEPAYFVVNGTSVCEDHGIFLMRHNVQGPSQWQADVFNREVDDLDAWKEAAGDGYDGGPYHA
jgi:hypothetical protein